MLLKWEAGNEEVIDLWKTMNTWVYDGFGKTYKSLGVEFDKFYYESDTYLLGKTIVEEGKKLAAIHPNIIVKVPMVKDGVKAIKWFTDNGIKTNCTLVFSAGQAILAAKAGAAYVSPFIGRIDDTGWDGVELIAQIAHIYSVQGFETEILAASIRSALHIVKCAEAGADVCTCPLESILGLLKHPLTDIGLAKFLEDAKKM